MSEVGFMILLIVIAAAGRLPNSRDAGCQLLTANCWLSIANCYSLP